MTPFCKYCGAVLAPGNIYCLNCGKPVVPHADDEYETVIRQAPVDATRKYRMIIFILGFLVFILASSALGLFLYFSSNRSTVPPANVSVNIPRTPQPSTQPETTPTPTPETTPSITMETTASGTCTVLSDTQVHASCDTKDCDNDPSTLNGSAAVGDVVTKLGRSVKARGNFHWENVSIGGVKGWISSRSLDCTTMPETDETPPLPRPSNKTDHMRYAPVSPWRGVPIKVKAICNDGTYSYTGTKFLQCILHGGVRLRR